MMFIAKHDRGCHATVRNRLSPLCPLLHTCEFRKTKRKDRDREEDEDEDEDEDNVPFVRKYNEPDES